MSIRIMKSEGYSGTPLARKLGIKEGFSVYIENEPKHYLALFSDFPKVSKDTQLAIETKDFIQIFVQYKEELAELFAKVKPALKKSGMLWVSWPKGNSKIDKDINRDWIREYLLGLGLVDVKVCAIDQDWSALKFVYRLKDR